MLKVKVTTISPELPLIHQTPGWKGFWGDCRFFVDDEVDECDFWIVHEGLLKREEVLCPPENTILVTCEPPTLRRYNRRFLKQFARVITCHRDIDHPTPTYSQQGLPWHVGRKWKPKGEDRYTLGYDDLKKVTRFEKGKKLSVISSSKTHSDGHKKRVAFVQRLKEYFGEDIDVFGRGICDIEDKWDAIAGYKYHIVIENSSVDDYWTEKLSDAFLGGTYPFYYGCRNIREYFPEKSLTKIDINDFERSISIIEEKMRARQYEQSVDAINQARELVLDKHNFFPMISGLVESIGAKSPKMRLMLKPEREFDGGRLNKLLSIFGK